MRQVAMRITAIMMAGTVGWTMLSGCDTSGSKRDQTTATSPSPAPTKLGTSVPDLEQFAGVKLPPDAANIRISARRNQNHDAVYLARFTTSEENAEAFCADNGLGGSLPWLKPLDKEARERFGVEGTTQKRPRNCRASDPRDMRIQREVIVTFPGKDKAIVHLLAYAVPSR